MDKIDVTTNTNRFRHFSYCMFELSFSGQNTELRRETKYPITNIDSNTMTGIGTMDIWISPPISTNHGSIINSTCVLFLTGMWKMELMYFFPLVL